MRRPAEQLGEMTVTVSYLIATSTATRDFHPIHHDPEAARAGGLSGIILNVHGATALIAGFALRVLGATAELGDLEVRLHRPVVPGDRLSFAATTGPGGDVSVLVASPAGRCLSGRVRRAPTPGEEPMPPTSSPQAPADPDIPDAWRELIGVPFGPRVPALEPVVDPTIVRLWREAFESPAAKDVLPPGGFGGSEVPAPMLGVWDMPGARMADSRIWADDRERMRALLGERGYLRPLTVACRQRYLRPLRLGDRLTAQTTLRSLSGPRSTAVGEGVFADWSTDFADADGAIVGSSSLTLLRYRVPVTV
jgi:acyl dehydratase